MDDALLVIKSLISSLQRCKMCRLKLTCDIVFETICVFVQGADAISTGRILETVVRLCFEAKQFDLLNENIIQLTKKRGQLKQVFVFGVSVCLSVRLHSVTAVQHSLKHTNNHCRAL